MSTQPAANTASHLPSNTANSREPASLHISAETSGKVTTPTPQPDGSSWKEKLSILSLVCAVASVGIATFALRESHESRLDSLRAQIRTETFHNLLQARSEFSVFNCYAAIRGKDPLPGKQNLQDMMDKLEPKIRGGLDELPDMNEASLMIFETSLNQTVGKPAEVINDALMKVRSTWSKDDLERADEACKVMDGSDS